MENPNKPKRKGHLRVVKDGESPPLPTMPPMPKGTWEPEGDGKKGTPQEPQKITRRKVLEAILVGSAGAMVHYMVSKDENKEEREAKIRVIKKFYKEIRFEERQFELSVKQAVFLEQLKTTNMNDLSEQIKIKEKYRELVKLQKNLEDIYQQLKANIELFEKREVHYPELTELKEKAKDLLDKVNMRNQAIVLIMPTTIFQGYTDFFHPE